MSGNRSYHSRKHRDRHYYDDRDRYYDHRRSRDRDSRDGHRSDYNQRRVPGLVSDPDTHLGDVDKAIQQGQRDTVSREQPGQFNYSSPTQYRPPISTVSKPYFSSYNDNFTKKRFRSRFYNPSFLAFFPALCGFALIITAIVYVEWIVDSIIIDPGNLMIRSRGLFQVCRFVITDLDEVCQTLEEFATSSRIFELEQATRGLIIISAILTFIAIVVCFLFGLNRWERKKGALVSGGLLAFAGACGVAGMACYSAFLVSQQETTNNIQWSAAGTSFFLGWFGTGLLLIASVTAFTSHFTKHKKY